MPVKNITVTTITDPSKFIKVESKKNNVITVVTDAVNNIEKNNKIIKTKEVGTKNKIEDMKKNLKERFQKTKVKIKEGTKFKNEIGKLVDDWKEIMVNKKCYNEAFHTMTLTHIKKQEYGWSSRIYAPYGKNLEELADLKLSIESGLKCIFLYEIPQHKEFALAKIIYPSKVKCNEMPYTPSKVKPYEVYPGVNISGEPIIFNVNDAPHILISGQQRRGKNGSLDHMLSAWIYWCSPKEVEIYIFQCAKNENIKYKNCKHVLCYIENNLDKMIEVLKLILKNMDERKKIFEPMVSKAEGNDNILHYNKINYKNKLSYKYIVIDEFIELIPDKQVDTKEDYEKKNIVLRLLQSIAQWGGTYGINYIVMHQKPQAALMPTFLKNMSSIRICFGFEDLICCEIVLGSELSKLAHKLPPRQAYYTDSEKNGYLYTTNLKGRIKKYIKNSIEPNHKTIFDKLEETTFQQPLNKNKSEEKPELKTKQISNGVIEINPKNIKKSKKEETTALIEGSITINDSNIIKNDNKETIIEDGKNINDKLTKKIQLQFDKVDPNIIKRKEEKIKKNISNIPGFVPYNSNQNIKIIDKTEIDNLQSQKPIKKKGVVSLDVDENMHNG